MQLLVWIFVDARHDGGRVRRCRYFINEAMAKAKYANADKMNFEAPLTSLVWLTSIVSVVADLCRVLPADPRLAGDPTLWWKLSTVITCGTLAGAIIPELVKVFTSTDSAHVREVVSVVARRRRIAEHSFRFRRRQFQRVLAGLAILVLMGDRLLASARSGLGTLMLAPAVFAFGLVAFGFLGMGPVTIAVDSTAR